MLDENSKKKLRRLWYKRLGISFGLVVALGLSFTKGLSIVQIQVELAQMDQRQRQALLRQQRQQAEVQGEKLVQTKFAKAMQELKEQELKIKEVNEVMADAIDGAIKKANLKQERVQRVQDFIFLALSVLVLTIMSLLLMRIQNQTSLSFAGQLICFIPEECVAELEALSQQLKLNKYPTWFVQMIIFRCFLRLIFALYVQIKIDNILLSRKKK